MHYLEDPNLHYLHYYESGMHYLHYSESSPTIPAILALLNNYTPLFHNGCEQIDSHLEKVCSTVSQTRLVKQL
jgi:hypothetical protein